MKTAFFVVFISAFSVLGYLFLPTPSAMSATGMSDIEEKLYNSCYNSITPKDAHAEPMCRCQAKKWAAGRWGAEGADQGIEIKKEYVDDLIRSWTDAAMFMAMQRSQLKPSDGEKLGLALGIGMECMQETGVVKPGVFDRLEDGSVSHP